MNKRINYTGRKSLSQQNLSVRLEPPKYPAASLSFASQVSIPPEWKLDPSARVYVEPYVKTSSMRFSFGTVGEIKPPDDTALVEVDHSGGVLFRVKVVDESSEVGKILASANRI